MEKGINLVENVGGEPMTTSLVVADGVGYEHRSVLQLIRNNLSDFEQFGRVAFEMRPFETAGGIQHREVAQLNEQHSTLLLAYMRNTPVVKQFKIALVREFFEMKKTLAPRGERLLALAVVEAQQMLEAKDEQIAELTPKAEAYSAFMDADGTYSIGNVAKMIGLSQNKLFDQLRNHGVLIAKGAMRNTPYQKYMHHFSVKAFDFERSDGTRSTSYTTRVQPTGVDFIRRKLGTPSVHVLDGAA